MLSLRLLLAGLLLLPSLAGAISVPAVNTTLPSYMQGHVLGKLTAADMNVTTDQAITINSSKYVVTKITVVNCSASISVALGGVYTAASKGGTAIVAATQAYAALTGSTKYLALTLQNLSTDVLTGGTLYFSLTLAQGGAGTCDVYVIGDVLP